MIARFLWILCCVAPLLLPGGCRRGDEAGPPLLIAHAGGRVAEHNYTNSREALDKSYAAGHRTFELDFSWTADERLVLVHGWDGIFKAYFPDFDGEPTHQEFTSLQMLDGLTQLSLAELYAWMSAHPDASVVTDVKSDNVRALARIARSAGPLKQRFIPQIYNQGQYEPARRLGFQRVILTLYRVRVSDAEVLAFVEAHPIFAVTMPKERALTGRLGEKLRQRDVFTYAHSVNSLEQWAALRERGIGGFYTDALAPGDLP